MVKSTVQSYQRERNRTATMVDKKPFLTSTRVGILAFIILATGIALLYLWSSWQAVHWLNEKHQAEIELQNLENERERLRFETGQAFSLNRIEAIARGRLGMQMPSTTGGTLNFLRLIIE